MTKDCIIIPVSNRSRGHGEKLLKVKGKTDIQKYKFLTEVTDMW